jgi:GT2 family glycosyltransferase
MIACPLVSVIIVTHNNQHDIIDCVQSVLSQLYQHLEIIIVDNASTDGTVNKIQENFENIKQIRLIKNPRNSWYAGGNNLGFHHSKGELIVILNPDLVVDNFWLSALVDAYNKHANAGIVCSNVLLFDDHKRINACANEIHLTGFVFARFYGEDHCECTREEVVAAPSGASFMFSANKLKAIGREMPFDSTRFFMDYSDTDLAIDFLSHGFVSYIAPSSKVFHKFKFKMDPHRLFILECGRYQILGHFRKKTLVMMLPALTVTELIVWSFILSKGRSLIRPKIKVEVWLFSHFRDIFKSDNSASKDLKLIKQMVSDIRLYDELSGSSSGSFRIHMALDLSNQLFRFTRKLIINLLSAKMSSS